MMSLIFPDFKARMPFSRVMPMGILMKKVTEWHTQVKGIVQETPRMAVKRN
jgi:hypothetical protein